MEAAEGMGLMTAREGGVEGGDEMEGARGKGEVGVPGEGERVDGGAGEDEGEGAEGGRKGAGGESWGVEGGTGNVGGLACRTGGAGLLEVGGLETSREEPGVVDLLRLRA